MHYLTRLLREAAQMVYPQPCTCCGKPLLQPEPPVCWHCLQQLPITGFEQMEHHPLKDVFAGRLFFERADALLFFHKEGLTRHLVHAFKYKNRQDVGRYMGRWMGERLQAIPNFVPPDALVPLPLNRRKLAKRGYNQAMLLCEGLAQVWQVPIAEVAVLRTRYTETQTRKSRIDRWYNVAEVFDLHAPESLQHKRVTLVDDVVTTGATMEACGQQLLKIPGLRLSLLSLAVAHSV
jgi:ComF family protein